MRVKEALIFGANSLKKSSSIPNKEARILLAHLLKKDQMWLITHEDEDIDCLDAYNELILRRINHEPIEYITNQASFYLRDFYVDNRVLIPRPETEILIDKVVDVSKSFENPQIVEVGCGSGIISIMLALLLPQAKITAVDISYKALEVAKINAKKHGVEKRIEFMQSDLLQKIDNKKIDILVSNPPYIADGESLDVGLSYEPDVALFGGSIGDEILKKLVGETIQKKIPVLACEMGYDQQDKLTRYLSNFNLKAKFYQDLAGLDRGFVLNSLK